MCVAGLRVGRWVGSVERRAEPPARATPKLCLLTNELRGRSRTEPELVTNVRFVRLRPRDALASAYKTGQVRCGVFSRSCSENAADLTRARLQSFCHFAVSLSAECPTCPSARVPSGVSPDDASTRIERNQTKRNQTRSVDHASRRCLGGRLPLVFGAAEGCHGHAMRSLVLSALPPRVVGPEGDVPFVPHGCH